LAKSISYEAHLYAVFFNRLHFIPLSISR
jgi:hypothetical protein